MPLTQAQLARNTLAGKIRARQPADSIEQARADLDFAKAWQTIAPWSSMSFDRRAKLAARLLSPGGNANAATT